VSGLFQLLSMGARNLSTMQYAQATTGNNAANAATPGYSRRRTNLVEAQPVIGPLGTIGTGVDAAGLQRLRDGLLDTQIRLDSDDYQYAKAQQGVLDQVGALLSPPDTNALATSLNALFAAFGDLATRPEDPAVRTTLIAQAQTTVAAFHQASDSLDVITRDAFGSIQDRVNEVNSTARDLAALNLSFKTRPGDPALLDQRDRLITRLAELVGVRATTQQDGTASVVVNGTGVQLVDGLRSGSLAVTGQPSTGSVTLSVDGFALTAPGGEIGGLLDMRNSTLDGLPSVASALDALAAGVISAVNNVHASGSGLVPVSSFTGSVAVANPAAPLAAAGLTPPPVSGTLNLGIVDATGAVVSNGTVSVDPATMSLTALAAAIDALPDVASSVSGGRLTVSAENSANAVVLGADGSGSLAALGVNAFFTGTTAHTIDVDPAVVADPRRIAAARANAATGVVSPGDNTTARALADLGNARIFSSDTATASEFLGAIGAAVGTASRAAGDRVDTLGSVIDATKTQQESISGVNVDEELADMVRYQHAYEASAKFVKTIDDMLKTVLDLLP
jgi:flagellar hook-associated protein 1 FlgK